VKGTNIETSKREGRESKNQGTTVGMTEEIAKYLGRKNARERKNDGGNEEREHLIFSF
jgi:hypothetical protein